LQYWEPQPAIQLNNAEAALASEELEKETEVLILLTQLVGVLMQVVLCAMFKLQVMDRPFNLSRIMALGFV